MPSQSRFQEEIQVSSKLVATMENQTDNSEYDPENIETLGNATTPLKEKENISQYKLNDSTPFLRGNFCDIMVSSIFCLNLWLWIKSKGHN